MKRLVAMAMCLLLTVSAFFCIPVNAAVSKTNPMRGIDVSEWNGTLDAVDALLILQKAGNKIGEFPVEHKK